MKYVFGKRQNVYLGKYLYNIKLNKRFGKYRFTYLNTGLTRNCILLKV